MITPQLFFPPNLAARPGELGAQVCVWGEAGPQGNPMGAAQPRPYPSRDPSRGSVVSFGAPLMPPGFGQANWCANVLAGAGSRSSELVNTYYATGWIKNNSAVVSF